MKMFMNFIVDNFNLHFFGKKKIFHSTIKGFPSRDRMAKDKEQNMAIPVAI
jgi:hypothetical protein